jgi:putative ABC transporter-associated repeat protein
MPGTGRRATRAALMAVTLTVLGPGATAAAQPGPADPGPVDPSAASPVRASEPTATGRTVIGDGHVDMGARFVSGAWAIQVRDDTVRPAVWRNLTDVVWHVVDAAKLQVPDNPQFAFLGRPGSQVWVLPQVQRRGVLWPGWNTQDPEVAATVNREVTWTLHGVIGPGAFVLFANADFGAPRILFNSARPVPQRTGIDVGTHVHGNWVFTAPGSYLLDIAMSARTRDGRQVTDRELLRVYVGAGDPAAAFTVAAPPGFPASTTPAAEAAEAADEPAEAIPGWTWLVIGGVGIIGVIGVATTVALALTARAARRGNTLGADSGREN